MSGFYYSISLVITVNLEREVWQISKRNYNLYVDILYVKSLIEKKLFFLRSD